MAARAAAKQQAREKRYRRRSDTIGTEDDEPDLDPGASDLHELKKQKAWKVC